MANTIFSMDTNAKQYEGCAQFIRFLLSLLILLMGGANSLWAQTYHTEKYDYDNDGVDETYNVVYINLGSGNDNNDGSAMNKAVKTWSKAYSKLPAYTGTTDADRDYAWDHNIIVVCDASNNQLNTLAATNKAPATITGVWPWTAANTTAVKVKGGGAVYVNTGNDTAGPSLGMDTKFKYVRFRSEKVGSQTGSAYLQCYLHDVTFDVGCVMDEIAIDLTVDNGLTKGNKAPDLHLMMYANTHNFTATADGGWPAQTKPMVLTIKSGKIGRLLSCRITGTSSSDGSIKNRYVVGNPSHPLTAIMNLDIDPNTSEGEWNSKNYTNDIEFCCAGATQGIEYCDIKFNIKRGKIGTLVSACQGMSITQTKNLGLSNSSFFGRTEVNLIPNNDDSDITINRYYGACLGRSQTSPSSTTNGIANTAFYGRSTLNMYGGRINNGVFISAGGVSGLQSTDGLHHTCDQYIPYLDNSTAYRNYPYMGIKYQPYNPSLTIAKVTTIMNGTPEVIDLAETVTTMNIYGGEIKGGIYGGSYGYSDVLRIQCAMEQAGSLWGDTHVNIYGGKISGGVYGGGQGSADFYNLAPNNRKNEFTTVASVYGNTNVNIYGGEIDGDIYGGGMGLKSQAAGSGFVISFDTPTSVTLVANEFLDIAKVFGKTKVIIDPKILKPFNEWAVPNIPEFTGPNDDWTFNGNIYGGGALGAVEGETNVIIKGGIINGEVFGAGKGEEGHQDKAKVTGNTNVIIDKNWTE